MHFTHTFRLSLALQLVTTTGSAAVPFDLPQVAIPAPATAAWPLTIAAPFRSPPATLVLPQVWVPCAGVFLLEYLPRTAIGLIELYGSEERFRTALQTTQIEVVHLSTRNAAAEMPGDYVERDPAALDEVQMSLLQHALTTDAAYDWFAEPDLVSAARYDLRIRLRHGEKVLTADLSLSARTVRVIDHHAIVAEQALSEYGYTLLKFLAEPADTLD